jgi:tetratricopeptide (TPR) repeat protein
MAAPTAPIHLRAQGIDALKSQRFDAAVESLNRYLDAAPNDTEAELALAAARAGQGKHVAALTIFERHLEREPQSPSLHYNRGTTLERLGRKDDALKAYKMVLKLKPEHAKAKQRLQSLGGIARPLPAGDIPMVIAVDGGDGAARRPKGKGRWIHPAWLAVLFIYAVGLTVLAGTLVSIYSAGRVAGELLLANIFLLAGIQTLHYGRRGSKRHPPALGWSLLSIGAVIWLATPIDPIWSWLQARGYQEQVLADQKAAREEAERQRLAAVTRRAQADARAKKRQADMFEKALQDIKSGDPNRTASGCATLAGLPRNERRAEVVVLLENLIDNKVMAYQILAISALGQWGTRTSLPKLEGLLQDRSSVVRSVAKDAIEKIKNREPADPAKGRP